MSDQRAVVEALAGAAARGESVVLASVVRTVGSAYRGVGTRLLVRADETSVGLVSGGCLEADLVERARRVRAREEPEVVTFDSLSEDDLVWGLGIGCNGLVELLVESLSPSRAGRLAAMLGAALDADGAVVLATVVRSESAEGPAVGARVLAGSVGGPTSDGDWGRGTSLARVLADAADVADDAWRGAMREYALAEGGVAEVAFEVIAPSVRLVICGSGPDAVPVARMATELGWTVTVVDHRPTSLAHAERFPGARLVECADATGLLGAVSLGPRTAVVVMSHHYGRDLDYLEAILSAGEAAYVGLLGPRSRTERMLADLATRGRPVLLPEVAARLFGPVGLDVGGEGPEAIALAIVAEVSAVMSERSGGHLRDRSAPIHASIDAPIDAPIDG